MKKKKLVYLLSASTLLLGVASCNNNDPMSKNFTVVLPKKSSNATYTYHLNNDDECKTVDALIKIQQENGKKVLSEKYSSIMFEYEGQDLLDGEITETSKRKFILDYNEKNAYCYDKFNQINKDKSESYAIVETCTYFNEFVNDDSFMGNTFILNTTITLKDYSFGNDNEKANGSVKITTTHKDMYNILGRITEGSSVFNYYNHSGLIYANKDCSYMYYSSESSYEKEIKIAKDGLMAYYYQEDSSSKFTEKFSYFTNPILNNKYDLTNYTEYEEDKILAELNVDLADFGIYVPVYSFCFSYGDYDMNSLLEKSETFRSWFTITK